MLLSLMPLAAYTPQLAAADCKLVLQTGPSPLHVVAKLLELVGEG